MFSHQGSGIDHAGEDKPWGLQNDLGQLDPSPSDYCMVERYKLLSSFKPGNFGVPLSS